MSVKKNSEIIQDFIILEETYPSIYDSEEDYTSVKAWLQHIKISGFNNKMMQEIIKYIYNLKEKNRYSEAIQLLLVSAATEDELAQYVLARELFIGKLFHKNIAASFGIISQLAQNNFAEAVCDLGYFYKNGIIVDKDKSKAKTYYYQAAQLGVKRALKSYQELN